VEAERVDGGVVGDWRHVSMDYARILGRRLGCGLLRYPIGYLSGRPQRGSLGLAHLGSFTLRGLGLGPGAALCLGGV
jgi:hypothetical protein